MGGGESGVEMGSSAVWWSCKYLTASDWSEAAWSNFKASMWGWIPDKNPLKPLRDSHSSNLATLGPMWWQPQILISGCSGGKKVLDTFPGHVQQGLWYSAGICHFQPLELYCLQLIYKTTRFIDRKWMGNNTDDLQIVEVTYQAEMVLQC